MSGDYSSQDAADQGQSVLENPYSILNLTNRASIDEIKASYKLLSRAFHPDKQPTGDNRESAQQYFIQLRASYDILIDPALRLAFDEHGMRGVMFMKRDKNMYKSVSALLDEIGDTTSSPLNEQQSDRDHKCMQQAREILCETLQYHEFYMKNSTKPTINGSIKIKCNCTHSVFPLGEGLEPMSLEVEESTMSMSVTKGKGDGKTSITFGGNGTVLNGKGGSNLNLSLNHEPVQGTDMNIDMDIGANPKESKLTFGTSRMMSNQTHVFTNLSFNKQGKHLMLRTSRPMMENHVLGTWIIGLGLPSFQMQYLMLSCSTTYPNQPKYTATFNVGMNYTPLELTAEKSFDKENRHTGKMSWGWSGQGQHVKLMTSRYLSKYCKVLVGLTHNPMKGLTWLFKLQHAGIDFTVPIFVTSIMSPAYASKTMFMTLMLTLIDESLGDLVQSGIKDIITDKSRSAENRGLMREEILLEREKVRKDARGQIQLMEKPAEIKRQREKKVNGLIILKAIYSVIGGDEIDVTTALMFWVVHSSLQLPSMTKSSMLGFYDIRHEMPPETNSNLLNSCRQLWRRLCYGEKASSIRSTSHHGEIPTLQIRYQYKGIVYEITLLDDEPVSLPSDKAMKLGGSRVIG